MQLTQLLEPLITQIATHLAAELKPLLNNTPTPPDASQAAQLASLRQENQTLSTKLTNLEAELASLKAQLDGNTCQATEQPDSPAEAKPDGPGGKTVDKTRAEKWVRENTQEWLDQPCSFKRAAGRTWRQLGMDYGNKIAINGRGPQSPRAYLHAIESWQECNVWARMKARVALEVGKQEAEQN